MTSTKEILCIYHGNCADGFGAAWAVRHALGLSDHQFFAATHQGPPPDVTGKRVVMVDFAYKKPVVEQMAEQAQSILILDHHKSAQAELAEYPEPPPGLHDHHGWIPDFGVYALFDMERSGAGIAWDYFHGAARPPLIDHIEDRDLWRFRLSGTREIQAAVFSYPYEFGIWSRLILGTDLADLAKQGAAIERKHHKDIAELVAVTKRRMVIGGHDVPVANLPYTMASDAGHAMAKGQPFAACYWDTADGRVFSLRSTDEGLDVSQIAVEYGGGGHRNAAGFRMPVGWEGGQRHDKTGASD